MSSPSPWLHRIKNQSRAQEKVRKGANQVRQWRAYNEITTTVDSTLTLMDLILSKLELVLFDYRGLDDLKLELNLTQNLLRCARFLSKSQSSILNPFCERLRHFYFLLRKESMFVYEMVAEIAKLRNILGAFLQEFCKWNASLLDVVLDKLSARADYDNSDDWRKLKLGLKLIRAFYHCAINGRDKDVNDCFLSDIRPGVDENAKQLYYSLVKLEASGKGVYLGLAESLASYRVSLLACCDNYKVWVRDLYSSMSNPISISSTYPWFCSELIGFLDHLLECLKDITDCGEASNPKIKESIDPIQKNLKFLKNFVYVSTFWAEKLQISESFVIHCQGSAIQAACLGYMFLFYSDDDCVLRDLQLKGFSLAEKTNLGNDEVTQKYLETLMTSRQSKPSPFMLEVRERHVVADFVDSLADKLSELMDSRTSCMVSLDNTVWMLGEGLELCRTFLRKQYMFNGLSQDEKNVLRELLYEAAMILLQLCKFRGEERLAKEINVRSSQLAEKTDALRFALKYWKLGFHLHAKDRAVDFDGFF